MFEKIAYAASGSAPASNINPIVNLLPLILLIFIFYFLLIRPQQKRQKNLDKMIQALKKGDRVVTSGGIIGTIVGIQADYVVLKIGGESAKMEILKTAISGFREKSKD